MNNRLFEILRHFLPVLFLGTVICFPLMGCGKKELPELSQEDREEARQEHMNTMREEMGEQ